MEKTGSEWFASWFDSKYYHILYKHRDEVEAAMFLDNLIDELQMKQGSKVLDLACGKGRHSQYLNQKGFDVTGIDYSASNIEHCKQFENDTLHFARQDMREKFKSDYFDHILNLFTSFGYFDDDKDNLKTIEAITADLKSGGTVVIDFLNANHVLQNLISTEKKIINGIPFDISKKLEDNKLIKTIEINDQGESMIFQEKVSMLTLEDFKQYFSIAGLDLITVHGDYNLSTFAADESERLILIARKP